MRKRIQQIKAKLETIIFGYSTPAGKAFDIVLIALIIFSIILVMLESVPSINQKYRDLFYVLEWVITLFFTLEYILRIWISKYPKKYIFSFFGVIDLLAILPSFLGIFFVTKSMGLIVFRSLRLLRIFRILKLTRYTKESTILMDSLRASRTRISVFLFGVLTLVIIIGTLMYLIEGPENGFVSIPKSIYWAIVTLTTVGFGDLTPQTDLGQFLASIVMIVGYGVIAIPTGIVSAEMVNRRFRQQLAEDEKKTCPNCSEELHTSGANYCSNCGLELGTSQRLEKDIE